MMAGRTERTVVTLLLVALVAAIGLATLGLGPAARLVPLAVAVPTLGLLALQVLLDVAPRIAEAWSRVARSDPFGVKPIIKRAVGVPGAGKVSAVEEGRGGRELSTVLSLLMMIATIQLFGLFLAVPAYVFVQLKVRTQEGWALSVAVAVGMCVLVYGVVALAPVRLDNGLVWDWLSF
jgi:hypothetical protein